jgi:hypothetical protein
VHELVTADCDTDVRRSWLGCGEEDQVPGSERFPINRLSSLELLPYFSRQR